MPKDSIASIQRDVLACTRCPRLVSWREDVAADPPRRHRGETYHARAVPGFGDPKASILIVGLAPAAHGANRTGRMFTGDRSGDWLYGALHRAGLSSAAESRRASDGLELMRAYITAACRCAPPANKPTREEFGACADYLDRELAVMWPRLQVIVVLGGLAWQAARAALARRDVLLPRPLPKFGHGVEALLGPGLPIVLMSYHPSQQNTFTGRLTQEMFDRIWRRAVELTA